MLHHCPLDGSLFCPTAGKWSLIPLSLPLLSFSIKCPSPLCPCRTEKKGGRRKKNERVPLSKSMSERGTQGGREAGARPRTCSRTSRASERPSYVPHSIFVPRSRDAHRPAGHTRLDPNDETSLCSCDNFVCVVSQT